MNSFTVIITAGGIGSRMGSEIPKQFLLLDNKPVLIHTIERFHAHDPNAQIILTLPSEWFSYWNELIEKYQLLIPHTLVEGGKERFHSVKNAIQLATGEYIAIHDAVRPLVSKQTLTRCWNEVQAKNAVIPVLALKDSIRQLINDESKAEDRSKFRLVQTPQCFSAEVIRKAYELSYHQGITDDASLAEEAGFHIHLVEGNEENIKITTQLDLLIANQLIQLHE